MKKERKDVNVKIRLTNSERQRIIDNLDGKTITEFIRTAIRAELERKEEEQCRVIQIKM